MLRCILIVNRTGNVLLERYVSLCRKKLQWVSVNFRNFTFFASLRELDLDVCGSTFITVCRLKSHFYMLLMRSFHGVPPEERSQWRGYLIKLGADNLVGARDEEQFIACFRFTFADTLV